MHFSRTIAAVRSAVDSTFANHFSVRLIVALMLTMFDGTVLATCGPYIVTASALSYQPGLVLAFTTLIVGLLITLARVWALTFRNTPSE